MLAISHDDSPQSIYNNPNLYPQIFPWLFLYGLGGIGATMTKLSEKLHKHRLLMYHDKRFQHDVCFSFVAFSHQQVKASTTGGFLLAETHRNLMKYPTDYSMLTKMSLKRLLKECQMVKP